MDMLGMYPTWYDPTIGSGWVLGVIAVIHVLASHTSVGAALIFAWLATISYKRQRPELLEYVRRYGVLLLVFSYVLGSITGPGIWFSATVASPRGLSALIHSYVWIWATEWVFFVSEVIGIYVLVYLAGKIDQKTHLKLTGFFAIASWCTMLIIIGILSFMMWPGQQAWYAEGGTLNGFYGPYTFGQMITRTAFMLMCAAVVGGIVASRITEADFRREMTRKLAVLGIVSALVLFFGMQWTFSTLPEHAREIMAARLPEWFLPSLWVTLGGDRGVFRVDLVGAEGADARGGGRDGAGDHDVRHLARGNLARVDAQALDCRPVRLFESSHRSRCAGGGAEVRNSATAGARHARFASLRAGALASGDAGEPRRGGAYVGADLLQQLPQPGP